MITDLKKIKSQVQFLNVAFDSLCVFYSFLVCSILHDIVCTCCSLGQSCPFPSAQSWDFYTIEDGLGSLGEGVVSSRSDPKGRAVYAVRGSREGA